jgi:hypothetical protein
MDGGASWTAPTRIAVLTASAPSKGFSIAARPGRLAVAWGEDVRALDQPSPLVHVRVYALGGWQPPVTLTAVPPGSGAYGWFSAPVVMLLASSRVGLAWEGCNDNRVADPNALFICGHESGIDLGRDILWSESSDGGLNWASADVVDTADPNFSDVASTIWMSTQLRGVLVSHPSSITFRRGFDAP